MKILYDIILHKIRRADNVLICSTNIGSFMKYTWKIIHFKSFKTFNYYVWMF